MSRLFSALAVGMLVTACSHSSSQSTSPTTSRPAPTTSVARPVAEGSPALLAACVAGAKQYSGVPIAAFRDPSDAGIVICWADGHVSKSPPPGPGGTVPPDFNRLVFKTTLDGKHVFLTEAGYRSSLPVKAPSAGRVLDLFVGTWDRHGMGLTIARSGALTMGWRVYSRCGVAPPPCDRWVGNNIYDGGRATMTLHATGRTTAEGLVLTSTDPKNIPLGAARAWIDEQQDLLYLVPFPGVDYPLCGPRGHNVCGA